MENGEEAQEQDDRDALKQFISKARRSRKSEIEKPGEEPGGYQDFTIKRHLEERQNED